MYSFFLLHALPPLSSACIVGLSLTLLSPTNNKTEEMTTKLYKLGIILLLFSCHFFLFLTLPFSSNLALHGIEYIVCHLPLSLYIFVLRYTWMGLQ